MLDWLKEILGEAYTDDIDKKVSSEIGRAFVSKADFNAVNEAKKTLDAQISERDAQLEALRGVDADGLKAEIDRLQAENKTAAEKHAAELAQAKIDMAVDTELIKRGALSVKAARAELDLTDVKLEDGKVTGHVEKIDALADSSKWLFGSAQSPESTGRNHGTGSPVEPTVAETISEAMFPKK